MNFQIKSYLNFLEKDIKVDDYDDNDRDRNGDDIYNSDGDCDSNDDKVRLNCQFGWDKEASLVGSGN